METQNSNSRIPLLLILLLGLGLAGAGWWGVQQKNARRELQTANESMSSELKGMEELKEELAKQVDSLQNAYTTLAGENQNLQGSLSDAQSALARKDAEIRAAKTNRLGEVNGLRGEIQQLLAEKTELESVVNDLREENQTLKERTGQLERDLSVARDENSALANLNKTIQGELKRLTLANFKASGFQVEVEGKKPKVTAKSGRARRIKVSFDLVDVPQEYQGLRPLYLSITDDKGTPIAGSNISAKANVNGSRMDILAVKAKDVSLSATQRLSFSHDLEDKLNDGYYRVSVFTDIGLLGASSFRLQ
jgi:predicted  nucleic acid-binding Zn-ribbon protein